MNCAQSRTVCVAAHESRAKIHEYSLFAGASSQRRACFLSTAKALSMPMPGALDDGSFSGPGFVSTNPRTPDPERKRNPCHGREPLPGPPAVLPDTAKTKTWRRTDL